MAACMADNDPINLALEAAIAQISVGLWPKEMYALIAQANGNKKLAHAIRVTKNNGSQITTMPQGIRTLLANGAKPGPTFNAITKGAGRTLGPLLIAYGLAQAATQVHCAGFCTTMCCVGNCEYSPIEGNILTSLGNQYF
jgi:uncharacterized membrane protein YecN with MAPEG domain